MAAYNLYDKLSAKLSWATSSRQAHHANSSGGFTAPRNPIHMNRFNRKSTGVGVVNQIASLVKRASENSGTSSEEQGF